MRTKKKCLHLNTRFSMGTTAYCPDCRQNVWQHHMINAILDFIQDKENNENEGECLFEVRVIGGERIYKNSNGHVHCVHGCKLIKVITDRGNISYVCYSCGEVVRRDLRPTPKYKHKIGDGQMEKPKDNDLHPVRFTNKEVGLIKHVMGHFSDYFEDEAVEFFETIREAETHLH